MSAQGPDWVYHAGPFAGGRVLAVHPGGAVFSQVDGNVLISWDGGRTWTVREEEPFAARQLEVLPDGSLLGITFSRVGRSFDLGRTWDDLRGFDDDDLRDLAVDPNGPWYVATDTTIYRTDDEGETWLRLPSDVTDFREDIVDMIVAENGALIVTRDDRSELYTTVMRRSTDGGQTWEDVPSGWGTRGGPFTRNPDGSLFLASYDPDDNWPGFPTSGLFHSGDDGATWTEVYPHDATGAFQSPSYGRVLGRPGTVEWDGPDLPVSAASSFLETLEGQLFANTSSYSVLFLDPPFLMRYGTGAYRYEAEAGTWVQVGPVPASVHALHRTEAGVLFAGTGQALLTSSEHGWEAGGVNVPVRAIQGLPDGRVLLGTDSPNGIRAVGESAPFPFDLCEYDCHVAALTHKGTTLLAAVDNAFYTAPETRGINRTVDDGTTWTRTLEVGNVRVLEAAGNGVFYSGSHGMTHHDPQGVGVYRSLDDGRTWAPFSDGLTNTEVHALHADGPASVYAGTEDGVFHSEDGGSWTLLGLQTFTVHALARTTDGLIAGTNRGAFRYDGTDWEAWGEALSERLVQVLLPVETEAGAFLVAGTDRGVYVDRAGLMTTPVEATEAPRRVSVRAYPNPAHTTLTLGIDVPARSDVRAGLYDVLGRQVGRVWDGSLPAGRHALDAPVAHLPSGTFLLVVEVDGQRRTVPITVIR